MLLILAGEAVFILPFVLQRVFRATVLDVFQINNTELGLCFTAYGLVAMVSYLFGGPIADRFEPRKLIACSLWFTALGGIVYASFPGFYVLQVLYGFWGFSTIFLFWSPMIKAARIWGGAKDQGKTFGILDGGRGLVGALFGVFTVALFANSLAGNVDALLEETRAAFKMAIYGSCLLIIIIGVLVWFYLKTASEDDQKVDQISFKLVKEVAKLPVVWLLMVIILTAYVGYKTTDIISLYARDVLSYEEIASAQIGTFLLFIRPIAGVAVGFIADRYNITRWLIISFVITVMGSLWFASGLGHAFLPLFPGFNFHSGRWSVRLREHFIFAVLEKGKIPLHLTGTAVGLASFIGFTPDVFAGVMVGTILDAYPGQSGHQYVFLVLAAFSVVGCWAAWRYHRISCR